MKIKWIHHDSELRFLGLLEQGKEYDIPKHIAYDLVRTGRAVQVREKREVTDGGND